MSHLHAAVLESEQMLDKLDRMELRYVGGDIVLAVGTEVSATLSSWKVTVDRHAQEIMEKAQRESDRRSTREQEEQEELEEEHRCQKEDASDEAKMEVEENERLEVDMRRARNIYNREVERIEKEREQYVAEHKQAVDAATHRREGEEARGLAAMAAVEDDAEQKLTEMRAEHDAKLAALRESLTKELEEAKEVLGKDFVEHREKYDEEMAAFDRDNAELLKTEDHVKDAEARLASQQEVTNAAEKASSDALQASRDENHRNNAAKEEMERVHLTTLKDLEADEDAVNKELQMKRAAAEAELVEETSRLENQAEEAMKPLAAKRVVLNDRRKEKLKDQADLEADIEILRRTAEEAAVNARAENDELDARIKSSEEDAKKLTRRLREEEAAAQEELGEKQKALSVTWGAEAESIEREHHVIETSAQYKIESLTMDADRRFKDYTDENDAPYFHCRNELEDAEKVLAEHKGKYDIAKSNLDDMESDKKRQAEDIARKRLEKAQEAAEAIAEKQKAADEAESALSAHEMDEAQAMSEAEKAFESDWAELKVRREEAEGQGGVVRAKWKEERAAREARFESEWQTTLEAYPTRRQELEATLGAQDRSELDAELALEQAREVEEEVSRRLKEHAEHMGEERDRLTKDLNLRLTSLEAEEAALRAAAEQELAAHDRRVHGAMGEFDADRNRLLTEYELQRTGWRERAGEYEARGKVVEDKATEIRAKLAQATETSAREQERLHETQQATNLEMDQWTEQESMEAGIAPLKKVVAKARSVALELSMFEHKTGSGEAGQYGYEEATADAEGAWIRREAQIEIENIDRLEAQAKNQLEVRRQAQREVLRLERQEIEARLGDRTDLVQRKRRDMKRAVESRLRGLDTAGERLRALKAEATEALAMLKEQVDKTTGGQAEREREQLKKIRAVDAEEQEKKHEYELARANFEAENNKQEQKVEMEALALVVDVERASTALMERQRYEAKRRRKASPSESLLKTAEELKREADLEERRQEDEKRVLEAEASSRLNELGLHQAQIEARVAELHVNYRQAEEVAVRLRAQMHELQSARDKKKEELFSDVRSAEEDLEKRRKDVDERRGRHGERKATMQAALMTERAESDSKVADIRVEAERAAEKVKDVETTGLSTLTRLRALRDDAESTLNNEIQRAGQQERRVKEDIELQEGRIAREEEAVAEDLRTARAALQDGLKEKLQQIEVDSEAVTTDLATRRADLEKRREEAAERARERDAAVEKMRAEADTLAEAAEVEKQKLEEIHGELEEARQILDDRREDIERALRSKKRAENIFEKESNRLKRETDRLEKDLELEVSEARAKGEEVLSRAEREAMEQTSARQEDADNSATRALLDEEREVSAQDDQLASAMAELDSLKSEAEEELSNAEAGVRAAMKERADRRKRERQRRGDQRASARKSAMERSLNEEFSFEEDMDSRLEKLQTVWTQMEVQRERELVARQAAVEAEKARRIQEEKDAINAERRNRLSSVQADLDRQRAEARADEARRRRDVEEELRREEDEMRRRWEAKKRERLAVIEADRAMKRDQLRNEFDDQREKLERELAALEVERTNKIREIFGDAVLPVPHRPSSAYADKFRDKIVKERVQEAVSQAEAEKKAELQEFEAEKRRMFEELAKLDQEMAELEAIEAEEEESARRSSGGGGMRPQQGVY